MKVQIFPRATAKVRSNGSRTIDGRKFDPFVYNIEKYPSVEHLEPSQSSNQSKVKFLLNKNENEFHC